MALLIDRIGRLDFSVVGQRFHGDENGKVSLLASMLMLALVALAGLVGNTGHIAKEKLETQNAADSIVYSSTLWMARGMNALTATNHLIGEASAMAVVHEALGGPELDVGVKRNTSENTALNQIIKTLKPTAPVVPSIYSPPPIPGFDRRVVRFVADRVAPANDRMSAFATIYDSRMALKRELAIIMPAKSFANLGFLVPPPWGYATAAAAYVVHIAGTANIVLIGKEWFVLDALEAIAVLFKPVKRIVERQLIPTLEAHGEFVAGFDSSATQAKPGIVNRAVERVVLELESRLDVQASLFPEFEKLQLPVEAEPKPDMRGSSETIEGWGSDTPAVVSLPDLGSDSMRRKLESAMKKMQRRIEKIQDDLNDLDEFEEVVDERLEEDDVDADEKAELEDEKRQIDKTRDSKQKRLEEIRKKLSKIQSQKSDLEALIDQPLPSQSANPSVKSVPRAMNKSQERYTQWVRATYPNADAFRAALKAWLERWAPKSKAAGHFEKWTNRYTLTKAWQFRSGYRAQKSGDRVVWQKKAEPLKMLVMNDTFRGSSRDRKGYEKWAGQSAGAKQQAEQLFTLIGVAHREYQPLFSEVLYPAASQSGITSYAQAIFYNANKQFPGSGRGRFQAKIGWDTLNWDPAVSVPEWGAPAHQAGAKWPWDTFDADAKRAVAAVKLNWQAKLMPVRSSRLKESVVTVDGDTRKNIEHAAKFLEELGNH